MNRKLISEAISNMDDVFVEETMLQSVEGFGHPLERTTNMENNKTNSRSNTSCNTGRVTVLSLH